LVLGLVSVLLFRVANPVQYIKELKLVFTPFRRVADHQWNRGGIGDSVWTILSSAALAVDIFFAHSVSLSLEASGSNRAKLRFSLR